ESCRVGDDVDGLAVDPRVARAHVDRLQPNLVRVAAVGIDDDLALPREHPGDAAGGAQVAPGPAEEIADLTTRAVAVVGQRVDHDGDAMRAIALEAELLERGPAQLACAALDGACDVVLRHVDVARLFHRQAEPVVAVRVSPTLAGGDRD